jgi:hypothetical protein
MTRYFLHIKDGAELLLDPEGSDLFDLDAARMEAIEGARQLIGAAVLAGDPLGLQRAILIEDSDGRTF